MARALNGSVYVEIAQSCVGEGSRRPTDSFHETTWFGWPVKRDVVVNEWYSGRFPSGVVRRWDGSCIGWNETQQQRPRHYQMATDVTDRSRITARGRDQITNSSSRERHTNNALKLL